MVNRVCEVINKLSREFWEIEWKKTTTLHIVQPVTEIKEQLRVSHKLARKALEKQLTQQ